MNLIKRNGGLLIIYLIFLCTALILVNDVKKEELNKTQENGKVVIKK